MLLELSISNFAIIEQTTIRFADGFNVLTGETGAGKSILIDALGAVLGTRTSVDLVRTGAKVARVEAAFHLPATARERAAPILDELGIESDDASLVLSRDIYATGRSVARINGRLNTASSLARIGSLCVDIHGQSDHLAILSNIEQRNLLDRFADLESDRASLGKSVHEWRVVRQRLESLAADSREREHRIDLLRFQATEINEASLESGEDDRLVAEREVLRHAEQLRTGALLALDALTDDGTVEGPNAEALLRSVVSHIDGMAELDGATRSLQERANEILVLAEELSRDLRDYSEQVEPDDARLAQLEDRLSAIQTLKRKYGPSIADILSFSETVNAELAELSSDTYDLAAIEEKERGLSRSVAEEARWLSDRRKASAAQLAEAIESSISELRMGKSKIRIEVAQQPDPSGIATPQGPVAIDASGIDRVEFLIAPNAGEMLKPLARIASGGETARLMLATKSILSDVDLTPTLVFDEIDVGIGGRSGQVVGEKLWAISREHQVIVITHLPQIAAIASHHLRIEKATTDERTISYVRALSQEEREVEIAAMIDGLPPGEAALLNAHTMLERARTFVESSP